MQETRVLVETKGTTGEETISYWFDLPIDVAEFEEKLGIGAESGDYRIIEKVLPYADEVHEHTNIIKKETISAIILFIKITVTLSASVFVKFSTINSLISFSNPGFRFINYFQSAVYKTYSHLILALEYLL